MSNVIKQIVGNSSRLEESISTPEGNKKSDGAFFLIFLAFLFFFFVVRFISFSSVLLGGFQLFGFLVDQFSSEMTILF